MLPEDEPQQRRQPQPDAGSKRAKPIAARKSRRIMMSLRLDGAISIFHPMRAHHWELRPLNVEL